MFVATALTTVVLAGLLAYSALRKLSHDPPVVQTYTRVGVPEDRLDYLAAILLAGAAGLIVGLLWAPIGLAAAAALIVYFLLAVAAHIRADDAEHLPTPVVILALSGVALALRLATA